MAAKKQEFTEHDLQGLKHFRSLRKLLVRLHGVGASRDKAGNRELFMDQYCVLVLIWLFNPLIKSLRGLQRTSDMAKVRKSLVKAGELRRAKDYFMSQVSLGVEDTLDHLLWAGEKALCSGDLPDKTEIRQKIEAVGFEDIQQMAQKVFRTGNLNLSLIGPVPEKMQREITKNLVIE